MRLPRQILSPALALAAIGCGSPGSAGRDIPVWSPGEPTLRIGALDGDPAYQLYRVTDATLLPDGRLVILNAGTHEVRVYGPDGASLVVFGGEGDGPGDLRRPESVTTVGDSLYVFDGRISVWLLPEGTHVRTARLEPPVPGLMPYGWLADGTLVAMNSWGGVDPTATTTVAVYAYDPNGQGREVARYPAVELVTIRPGRRMAPHFSAIPAAAAAADRLYATDATERRIDVFDGAGQTVGTVTWDGPPLNVTDEALDAFLGREMEASDDPARVRQALGAVPVSQTFPALAALHVATDGSLWVCEYRRPGDGPRRRWLVFRDGELAERVTLPEGAELLEAGVGYLVVRERDELDVERVAVFER